MSSIENTVVITGASRRLGLFLTESFLKQGDNVVCVTRTPSTELQKLQCERLTILPITRYDADGAAALADELAAKFSRIDLLVHNASIFDSDADVKKDFAQHYKALFDIHMAVPAQLNLALQSLLSVSGSGNIIHITDIYAENPKSDFALYCSTKAGLENLMKGFAKKFAPAIRVNSIQPGPIQFLPEHNDAHKEAVLGQTLLAEEGGFFPIYQAVQSVLQNRFMTGVSIKVDGGRSLSGW